MAGTVKKLQFSEGTDVGAPTDLSLATSTTVISAFADDAAYVTSEGPASNGSVYLNTTTGKFRYYITAWRNAVPESDLSDPTKTFLVDVSGSSTGISSTLDFNNTSNRVYTFPDTSLTVAGRSNSETFQNKTLESALLSGGSLDVSGAGAFAFGASVGAFNFDIGGATTNVRILGNLEVQGTTTTLNTTTVDVEDTNITLNKGGTDGSSEGSGITVDRTGTKGSIIYANAATSRFKIGDLGSEIEVLTISGSQVVTNKDIDGGTASNTRRITLPKDTTTNINALTRKQGTLLYDTTTNQVKFDNGTTLTALGAGSVATADTSGTITSFVPVVKSSVTTITNADYTVLDNDGYDLFLFSTGASNRTLTLPTASDNTGRTIQVEKTDSGAGIVIVDGEGAETINGATTYRVEGQYNKVILRCNGSAWFVISHASPYSQVRLDTGNGHGSTTGTKIRLLTNSVLVGSGFTVANSATNGTTVTIVEPGIYSITYSDQKVSVGVGYMGISINGNGTTLVDALSADKRLTITECAGSGSFMACAGTIKLGFGDVIAPHTQGSMNGTGNTVQFTVTQMARL